MYGCDLQRDMDSSYQRYTQEKSQCLIGCTTEHSLHTRLDQVAERTFSAVDNQDDADIVDPWRLVKDGCVLGGMLQWYE